jgi:preprotein translocase subunit YajC
MDFSQLLPDFILLALFVIGIYSFSVLPRQREFQNRQKLVSQLQPGTEVITYGGMVGKVTRVEPENGIIFLEIAKGVEAKFIAQSISAEFDSKAISESAKKGSK